VTRAATVQPALRSGRAGTMLAPGAVAAAAAAAVGVIAVVDPNEPGHYPTCPFLAVTGQLCPGCGSLRAVHALAHGEIGTAAGLNVLTVLAVVPLLVIWLQWLRRSWTGAPRRSVAPAPALWALVVVVCVFAVVRNLPAGAALAP
jgi:hypothetical protein